MRSLTKEQVDNHLMDEAVMEFMRGKGLMMCDDIAEKMGENAFDVRRSLIRLMDRGDIHKQYLKHGAKPGYYYERAHGGYSPGGSAA